MKHHNWSLDTFHEAITNPVMSLSINEAFNSSNRSVLEYPSVLESANIVGKQGAHCSHRYKMTGLYDWCQII